MTIQFKAAPVPKSDEEFDEMENRWRQRLEEARIAAIFKLQDRWFCPVCECDVAAATGMATSIDWHSRKCAFREPE